MTGSINSVKSAHASQMPAMLPSRKEEFRAAFDALEAKKPVFISGNPGAGRTTFGQRLLGFRAREGRVAHKVVGSKTLKNVPFAAISALTAQIPGIEVKNQQSAEAITALAAKSLSVPRTIYIDKAELIDAESAAVLVQLIPQIELIFSADKIIDLPNEARLLAYEHGSHHTQLGPLTVEDTRICVEDLLQSVCNASTVNRFFNLSAGNPMYLRELVLDAQKHGSLPTINGYKTLSNDWVPSGTRLIDLITIRLAALPQEVREAAEIIAVTGPLHRMQAVRIIKPVILEQAISSGLLTSSMRNATKDIAQIFDGPGARSELNYGEELVQLGAGLTSEMLLTTATSESLSKYIKLIKHRLNFDSLSQINRMHIEAVSGGPGDARNFDGANNAADDDSIVSDDRNKDEEPVPLADIAEEIVLLTKKGFCLDAVQLFAQNVDQPLWHASTSLEQTIAIQAMFIAMSSEGSRFDVFDKHFLTIDWHDVSLDHALFLSGRGDMFLELGDAAEAKKLFAQSLGISSMQDQTNIKGFTFGLDAVAGVMLGEAAHAKEQYSNYLLAPKNSGGLARFLADRLTLAVILELEGRSRAKLRFEELLQEAETNQMNLSALRLLHEAWRLKLLKPDEELEALLRISVVASEVQGVFAQTLKLYYDAFGSNEVDYETVEKIVQAHLETGRVLYAAEVAARACEHATKNGDRSRTSYFLNLFAQVIVHLGEVNTPSLGRARIDPDLLSEREVEICVAAAEGKTNAEIALEFFLSPRTVEGHLQRAYSKLGVIDRRQLLPAVVIGAN